MMAAQEYYQSFDSPRAQHGAQIPNPSLIYPPQPYIQAQAQPQTHTPPHMPFINDYQPGHLPSAQYQQQQRQAGAPLQNLYPPPPTQQHVVHWQPAPPPAQQQQQQQQLQPYPPQQLQTYPPRPPRQIHFQDHNEYEHEFKRYDDDEEDDDEETDEDRERERGNYPHLTQQRSHSAPPRHPHEHHHHHHHHHHHSPSSSHSSSRSGSRDRERERERPRNRDLDRVQEPKKRPHSSTPTFLGAFGGSVVGDAIFPGLGTLGGALLGGFGGHEVGKRKVVKGDGDHHGTWLGKDTYEEEYEEGRRRRGEI